jgi:hypothetical protein
MADSQDNANGADFGNSFGGDISAAGGPGGFGGIGGGNGIGGSGIGGSGISAGAGDSSGGLDANTAGFSTIDLSGSTPGVDPAAGLFGAGMSIGALAILAGGNPFSAVLATFAAARGVLTLEQQAAAGVAATLSPNQDIAVAQLGAFAGQQ